MATIDDKVVAMSFESSKFESGVHRTISALDKLKAALHFPGAGKGLADIDAASRKLDFSHIGKAVDDIKSRLNAFRLVAIAVFAQVAQKAIAAGVNFAKAFTIDPMKAGFTEYATNLNAVQTILANTQAAGVGIKEVNATLKELNEYSDKTIYNFSQMARNIGTFTAAGVELDTATSAIKGIANLAALSGSNAEQASTAMYQLSQAISAGRVSLMDWNSVVNAGMGGTVFQRALAQTAEAMGTLKEGTVKLTGPMKNVSIAGESFRQSLSAGPGKDSWLTSKVLTATLKQFTSDMSDAELAAMGFNAAQIKAIQATAKTAMFAATEVKTLKQVLDVARETAASGWAQTWQIIFGDFAEAKKTFTALSNTINDFINTNADARNKVLGDWKALGGRTVLIEGIKNAFEALKAVLKPIKEAFRDIFPATTGKDLYDLTVRFREFTEGLRPSAETIENLKRTFRGFFALLSIGGQLLSGIFSVFARLFGVVTDGSGGFLKFTGNIGDFLVSVDQALKKGQHFTRFFERLADILAVPAEMIKTMSGALIGLFSGALPGGLAKQMSGLGESMSPLQVFINNIAKTWNALLMKFTDVAQALGPAFDAIIELVRGLGIAIGEAASNMNFEAILQVIRTGLFAGIFVMFKNFFGKGSLLEQVSKGFGGGILANIAGSFKALEGSMVAMQNNIKAKTLKEIAIAIALLTASVVALSFVDPERLKSSLTAMTVAFGQLLGAMAILGNISKSLGFIKMPVIAAALILLAGAIIALSLAVVILSRLSWEELAKGLGGVVVLLGILSAAVIPLSANSAGMIRVGIALTAIAIALNLMALAVRQLSSLSLTELGKGLVGIGVGLAILVGGVRALPPGMALAGASLIAIAFALKILAGAVEKFGGMAWGTIGKGMASIGAALVVIALAMRLMPKNMVLAAAGLLIVSLALGKIADAVQEFGGMSLEQIAKGLGVLAGSMLILAAALYVMSGTVSGAAALALAAAGLALLAPALVALGKQSWESIIKGLITLAAALTIIGIAGALITPVIPSLLGLGVALLLLGAGLALAGAGIFLIATGLSALAVAAPTGVGIIVAAFVELQKGVIENVKLLILGLLEIVKALAATAPQFVDALVKILKSLLDVIIEASPMIAEAFNALLNTALNVLSSNQGRIIQAGFDLLVALLQGIKNNIPQLVALVADIVARFLSGIANNLGKIITAGTQILISLLKGIASGYAGVVTAVIDIITRFLNGIANNLGKIATAGLSILTSLLKAIAGRLGDAIAAGVDIIVAVVKGIGNAAERIVTAARESAAKFINTLAKQIVALADQVFTAMINLINGLARVVESRAPELRGAAVHLGVAIIQGMTSGLTSAAGDLYAKAEGIAQKALSIIKKPWSVLSPSKTMAELGQNIILGMVLGLDQTAPKAYASATAMSNGVIGSFNNTFKTASPSKVMIEIGKAVGQGFAVGLRGSADDIKQAFAEMNEKLTDQMVTSREIIAKEQDKLDELRKAKKPDAEAIKESQKIIQENEDLLARSTAGHITLTKTLRDEKAELLGLADDYVKIGAKLDEAKAKLVDAKKTKTEAIQSFTDQYASLPDIVTEDAEGNSIDALATYMGALDNQAKSITAYQSTLEQLRKLGLDDATYQKLLKEGPQDASFANQLLAGGKTAVAGLNKLDTQLMNVSKTLATNAAANLYDAGIKTAQGLVKGLASQHDSIEREMKELANEMVAALKRSLKIKSPSEVFAEIGVLSMEGMAQGFSKSSHIVTDAVDQAAADALAAMKKSMSDISDVVTNELNPNPVITPILDLTQVRAQAGELGALTKVVPISAAASYGQASLISANQTAAQTEETVGAPGATSVKFEQNNYSPEALTEIEIYRQTKNQLSQLKSVLAIT